MAVLIHGGPSTLATSEWPAGFGMSRAIIAALSSSGYYVLLPNPRGSYGQGEEFTRANVKDFGHGDLRDNLAGIDAAIKKYPVDPDRLGVTGWRYGGLPDHSDRAPQKKPPRAPPPAARPADSPHHRP